MIPYEPTPHRVTYRSDRSGRRAALKLWTPLIIIGVCIVVLIGVLIAANVMGMVR